MFSGIANVHKLIAKPRYGHAGNRVSRAARALVLPLFDIFSVTVCAAILSFAFISPAYAYVDPSVMTYTIQALAGVAVALSAVAGVAFRRTRKKIMKALNIDENAKKEADPAWARIESGEGGLYKSHAELAPDDVAVSSAEPRKNPAARTDGRKLSWPRRLLLALIVAFFCSMTLLVVAPFAIVAGARGDLLFGIGDVGLIICGVAVAAAIVLALAVSLFRGKAFSIALCVVFGLGLCCYIQAMFMNGGLPYADGRIVDWWGDHGTMMVVSLVIWIALVAGMAAFSALRQRMARAAAVALSAVLIVVQGVGVISLLFDADEGAADGHEGIAITEKGLFEVSESNNVIVFVLDCFDTRTLDRVVGQNPDALADFDGFTWYHNAAGVMIPTGFALPYLMTGQTPAEGQDINDYLVTRYTESDFLERLRASGYSVGVYTTTFGSEFLSDAQLQDEIYANLDNAKSIDSVHIDAFGAVKILVKASLYRDAPWVAKQRFRFYTNELNQQSLLLSDDDPPDETRYIMDDVKYFHKLKELGLTAVDDGAPGAFRLIHLDGDHVPFAIDENGEYVGEGNSSQEQQARGSLRMVSTYLEEMKELGVFDDATIIVTADHGDWEASLEAPDEVTSPIILVKPPHAELNPVQVSESPVSHADFFATILQAMGQDASGYGDTIYDQAEGEQRVRDFYHITHDAGSIIKSVIGYRIGADALNFDDWELTGDTWPCDIQNAVFNAT